MKQWGNFLFGKPERTLKILLILGIVYAVFNPGDLKLILIRLINEVQPVLGSLLAIGLLIYAFRRLIGK